MSVVLHFVVNDRPAQSSPGLIRAAADGCPAHPFSSRGAFRASGNLESARLRGPACPRKLLHRRCRLPVICKPTVLIFGAGVSCDYGFPSGRKLLIDIANNLQGPSPLYQSMRDLDFGDSFIVQFSRELSHSMLPSVDAFLAVQTDKQYVKLGKSAIAASLILLEKKATLQSRSELKLYEYLWQRLAGTPGTYASNRLSIITFNYDRSFEYFLRQVLFACHPECRKEPLDFDAALSHFEVLHIYGSLGALDQMSAAYLPYDLQFHKGSMTSGVIAQSASRLQLYNETTTDKSVTERIAQVLKEAEIVCFLGFGFHELNIRRLEFFGLGRNPNAKLFGSAYGLGEGQCEPVRQMLGSIIKSYAESQRESLDDVIKLPDPSIILGRGMNSLDFLRSYHVLLDK